MTTNSNVLEILHQQLTSGCVSITGITVVKEEFLTNLLEQYSYYSTEWQHHKSREDYEGILRRHELYEGLNAMRYVLNQLGVTDNQLATL